MSIASLMNTTITIQRKTAGVDDGMGGRCGITWSDWFTVPARVQPLRGEELLTYRQLGSRVENRIYIEYTPSDITSGRCRIKHGVRYYDIERVSNVDEANVYLVLDCMEFKE